MSTPLHIFLLDDHPINLEGIQNALEVMDKEFVFKEATHLDIAIAMIQQQPKLLPFDIAFIDIGLPPSTNTDIHSGEGIAKIMKEKFPECKIIIQTQFFQAERVRHIIKTVNPEGLLLKTDFRGKHIRKAVEMVLQNEHYYSPGVLKAMRSHDFELDDIDLKILYCLSHNIKMKDMPEHIPLSLRAIEDRKSALMVKFEIPPRNNELLLQIAKEKGLI